ncbi:hypothetical protein PV11_00026 [Exophiala sideris]|uniref:Uncharacterized protein n=1 Tax=Exophiala sideris TaxID=1016849 RepID=A0A0D1W6D1_9EURO|nr:hypothetical protein PV11_00026 [Exophiala sideris]
MTLMERETPPNSSQQNLEDLVGTVEKPPMKSEEAQSISGYPDFMHTLGPEMLEELGFLTGDAGTPQKPPTLAEESTRDGNQYHETPSTQDNAESTSQTEQLKVGR